MSRRRCLPSLLMRSLPPPPLLLLLHLLAAVSQTHAYSSSPPLNRRVMAGLWRLTSHKTSLPWPLPQQQQTTTTKTQYPMKEFTVYPKKAPKHQAVQNEFLLMLKEDGSFLQYGATPTREEEEKLLEKQRFEERAFPWRRGRTPLVSRGNGDSKDDTVATTSTTHIQGTWDFRDGRLILAADRPPADPAHRTQLHHDTILVGKVVATSNQSLSEHPILQKQELSAAASQRQQQQRPAQHNNTVDTHLSVPQGSVEIGRFTYPKHHPSFFEQPMFQPKPLGSFQLRQVLGSLNTQQQQDQEEDELLEKFKRAEFYNKRFLLTSHPLETRKPKGRTRWSIKYNRYVEDTPKKSKAQEEQEKNAPIPIRVMELQLFANHTFATLKGLGQDAILRGKWDIIGRERDQLWMQVWRFGFGRSVSGSVYSEGRALSHNDAKTYWGTISYIRPEEQQEEEDTAEGESLASSSNQTLSSASSSQRLQVKGSVIYGWGLEPQPVARFLMTESEMHEYDDMDEEEDDDEEEDFNDDAFPTSSTEQKESKDPDGDRDEDEADDDWYHNAFQ